MPPKKHARLGASSSERWIVCPGSIAASEGMPNESSVYSREGTAAHGLAEMALTEGLPAADWIGETIYVAEEDATYPIEVTEEMAEAVQVFVDLVFSRVFTRTSHLHPVERFLEVQFDLEPLNPPEPMYGTADAVTWDPTTRTLYVDDYKHGQGVVVEAVDNSQIAMYGLGAVLKLRKRPDRIVLTICQPRASHPDGRTRSWEITWDELLAFKDELMAAARRTQDPDAPLVAGDHCRFCPASPTCLAQRAQAMEVAQTDFDAVDVAEELAPPERLTHDELRFVLDKAPLVESWFNAVRAYAQGELEAGREVPGYKLVAGRSNRRWVDEEKAARWLIRRIGKKGAYTQKLLSVAQAEKTLKKEGHVLKEALVEKPEGKPKLAPAENVQAALLPPAVTDFA